MAKATPYFPDGAHYRCSLCKEQIPDGASVDATWDANDDLVTVIVSMADGTDGGTVVHSCG